MKIHHLAGPGLAALLALGTVQVAAIADARHDARQEKKAADNAVKASKAIAKKQWDKAIAAAETAVALSPDDAGYRTILGSAYLKAGRFASAETAYGDALTLRPSDARVALNLALAQIATGKWAEARTTLDRHADTIPAADRGLALALAGDPAAAVTLLTAATRTAAADAKTRQNLALAMALSGEWQQARTLIGLDLAPAEADARIVQWAAFARPAASSDQVAALLGVTPVKDPGQPVALALAGAVPVEVAAAVPVDAYMPGPPAPEVVAAITPAAPVPAMPVQAAPVRSAPVAVASAPVQAAPRRVEPVRIALAAASRPVPLVSAPLVSIPVPDAQPYVAPVAKPARLLTAPIPYKTALSAKVPARSAKRAPAKGGDWVVQIGAFQNAAVAQAGWKRATRRFAALSGHLPAGMNATVRGANFYRLSIGGFARADAVALCRSYRAKGGTCFVRQQAGDRLAAWAQPKGVQLAYKAKGVQLAMR